LSAHPHPSSPGQIPCHRARLRGQRRSAGWPARISGGPLYQLADYLDQHGRTQRKGQVPRPAISGHPGNPGHDQHALEAAQADTDKALARLDGPQPESVTVNAIHSFPAGEIARAGRDADIIVLGSRGADGSTRLMIRVGGGQPGGAAHAVPATRRAA
jgi:nucleotide-binding universal stress UspA family protein